MKHTDIKKSNSVSGNETHEKNLTLKSGGGLFTSKYLTIEN